MAEKLNIEQSGFENREQTLGINPEVERPKGDVHSTLESQSPIIKIDPRDLNIPKEENNRSNKEPLPNNIETSGSRWGRVVEEKKGAGLETELPL